MAQQVMIGTLDTSRQQWVGSGDLLEVEADHTQVRRITVIVVLLLGRQPVQCQRPGMVQAPALDQLNLVLTLVHRVQVMMIEMKTAIMKVL